jgi:hypothetical protein
MKGEEVKSNRTCIFKFNYFRREGVVRRKLKMKKKWNINLIKEYCISIGYICLSDEYITGKTKLNLICNNKHQCTISFSNLYHHKRRCIHCSKRDNKSLEYVINFCNQIGWKCLEDRYINCVSKMLFECPNFHKVFKNFRDLEAGKGCKICLKMQTPTIEEVKEYCVSIGFILLSETYKNAKIKLKLKCDNDHTFYCCLDKLKHNRGCPYCSSSKSEKMIRFIIETLIGEEFLKVRPDFLKSSQTNRNYELDMFNERLMLAFEYQGNQHFELVSAFKMTEDTLLRNKERDLFKKEKCKEVGIKLICIPPLPYTNNKHDPQEIKNIITDILIKNNIYFEDKKIISNHIMKAGNTKSKFNKKRTIASEIL